MITGILAILFGYFAFLLPLAPTDTESWYSGLYMDITLPDEERFNALLVFLEVLFLSLTYLFLTIALAAQAQVQRQIPSWTQLVISGIITLILASIFPEISVGEASLEGASGSGYNHFTPAMQTWTFWGTVIGVLLFSLYIIYTSPPKVEAEN